MQFSLSRILILVITFFISGIYLSAQTRNGIVITKDDNGVIREKGKMEKGKREGEWQFFYSDGKPEHITTYAADKKNGREIFFYSNGDTMSVSNFKNDIPVGERKKWNTYNRLTSLEHFDDKGNPVGVNYYWDPYGNLSQYSLFLIGGVEVRYEYVHQAQISRILNLKNGVQDGKTIVYNTERVSDKDSILKIVDYKNGVQDGFELVYSNGWLYSKTKYCDDQKCDTSFTYNEKGDIVRIMPYKNGMENGVEKSYDNGKIISETDFVKGLRNGRDMNYSIDGIIKSESWYKDNQLDSTNTYFLNVKHTLSGKVRRKSYTDQPYHYVATDFYENGNMKSNYEFILFMYADKLLDGPYMNYFPNGKNKSLYTYKSGMMDGKYKKWNENGVLVLEANYSKKQSLDSARVWTNTGSELKSENPEFDKTLVQNMDVGMSYSGSSGEYFKIDSTDSFEQCKIYTFAEIMPTFPGDGFLSYLSRNIKYPQMEKEAGIHGTVYITFIVTSKGEIKGVTCVKEVPGGPGLTKETLRVIKSMPNWYPGMNNGKPVNVRLTQPVRFVLN